MRWKLPQVRFGLRTLLLVVLLAAIGAWLYTNRPERLRAYRNQLARQQIDPYELAIAGEGDPAGVPPELVAILGDSRLKHWGRAGAVKLLDGDQLASTGLDQRVRIWSTDTGRQLHQFDAKSVTASGDRKLAFLGMADGTVRVWDVAAGKALTTLGEPETVDQIGLAASGDGSVLAAEAHQRDRSREITIWSVPQASVLHRFRPAGTGGEELAVSHDGQFFTWGEEQQIRLASCQTGEMIQTFGPIMAERGGRCHIGQVGFSADGNKLFVGSALRSVVVFDRNTGQEVERFGWGNGSIHQFALGPREESAIFGGVGPLGIYHFGSVKYWQGAAGGQQIGTVDWRGEMIAASNRDGICLWLSRSDLRPWRLAGGPTQAIRHLVFHPDGRHLFTGDSTGQVEVYDVANWQVVRRWKAHDVAVKSLSLSASGSRLLTAANDHTVIVWNPQSGVETCVLREMLHLQAASISPDGRHVVGGVRNQLFGDEFAVYDASQGDMIRKVGPIKHGILSPPAWSSNGSRVAFLDQTNSLQIFDTSSWKNLGAIGKTRFGGQEVVAVWLSDNRRLVTTHWGNDAVHVLEVGKPLPVLTINAGSGQGRCVAVHPSEEWIVLCGYKMPVQIWHLATSKLVKFWQIGPPAGEVTQVAFSSDGHYLATVNGNGTVYVLSLDGVLD